MKITNREQASKQVVPTRRLSLWRVLLALWTITGLGYYGFLQFKVSQEKKSVSTLKPWFAAYADVTATPTYAFEQLGITGAKNVVLSFIVSTPSDPCTPSWGTAYSLEQAGSKLDLDRRIARLRQQGGAVSVSFGGALNDELSLKCENEDKLLQAYLAVINRYNLDTIDLDLENTSLGDKVAMARRALVIAKLQKKQRSEGKSLAVWLTLPVAPQGLTEMGTNAVKEMLGNGTDLAGVNVMTMDYGESKEREQSMHDASSNALTQTHRQLDILYKQAGIALNSATLWRKVGATPMIGQNDVVSEVFTIEDATVLNQFAREHGVGRMSFWSANRDIPCGENYVDTKVVSDSCSGVKTEKFGFAKVLSNDFDGSMLESAVVVTKDDPSANVQIVDDPAKSPYQIWSENGTYLEKVKVVWHGNVYEAKWWTKGDVPDNPVLQAWETPWQLIGPVLPGEKPIPQPTLPAGTYPEWSGKTEYQAGQRILFEGRPYIAKWWNSGESPAASSSNTDTTAWAPISQKEIGEILEKLTATK